MSSDNPSFKTRLGSIQLINDDAATTFIVDAMITTTIYVDIDIVITWKLH